MENLEQPNGSNENFGKFKDAESLMKAYSSLEAEFTKKSQKLSALENEKMEFVASQNKRAELEKQIDELTEKFDKMKPFSGALKETLLSNENANLHEEALRFLSNNFKTAEDFLADAEFMNNYIFSNQEIKDRIVKEYLNKLTLNSPIKYENSGSSISLTPPKVPTTIQEAGKLARTIIKQK